MRLLSARAHPSMAMDPVRPIGTVGAVGAVGTIDTIGMMSTIRAVYPVRLDWGHLEGKLLEILVVGDIVVDSLADHLLALLAKLLPPLLVLLLDRDAFLMGES